MDEKQQESTNMSWGMPRGLYQQVKYYGIPLLKAGFVAMTFIMGLQLSGSVFPVDQPIQFILCLILMTSLAFFLVLPSQAGGTNAMAIVYFHVKRKKGYISIDRNAYPDPKEFHKRRKRMRRL